ncbi:MAG: ECF-type sigma factor [Bryobacteraceae bacterium]
MAEPAPDVTQMLLAWRGGNHEAFEQLPPLVYGELRRLARHHLLVPLRDHGGAAAFGRLATSAMRSTGAGCGSSHQFWQLPALREPV